MFTGIIEQTGVLKEVLQKGGNKSFLIESGISGDLKPEQSLCHNGVCLTVEKVDGSLYQVTAIEETLKKSNLGSLNPGDEINLERCLIMNGRIDGHIVQGHVDGTATCISVIAKDGSWEYEFEFDPKFASLVIEKGSICLNGISLTVFDATDRQFKVAIIPYTFEHTNIKHVVPGKPVNLEFDIIGKYILRQQDLRQGTPQS
jgi:riboflavin synthase